VGLVAEVVDASRSWLELSIFYISTTKKQPVLTGYQVSKKAPLEMRGYVFMRL
jgi:hypothetical protein